MSLYDELLQFQILPHAFFEWSEYRTAITEHILQQTAEGSTLAVFGAGRCHDIDLARMAEHFSSITLFDMDMAAMQEALSLYELSDAQKIHLQQTDFTGISASDYRAFSDALSAFFQVDGTDTDIHMFAEYTVFLLEQLYRKADAHCLDFGSRCYDYSMAFGVHSQINNMAAWIFSTFAAHLNQSEDTVNNRIIHASEQLIPRFNDAILKATKTAAFFGCELENAAVSGGIQGACQCILDLRDRNIVTEQFVTYWPFDLKQDIIYKMLIQKAEL